MFFTSRRELIGRTSRRKRIPGNHTDWTQYDYRELFGGSWGEKNRANVLPNKLTLLQKRERVMKPVYATEIPLTLTELKRQQLICMADKSPSIPQVVNSNYLIYSTMNNVLGIMMWCNYNSLQWLRTFQKRLRVGSSSIFTSQQTKQLSIYGQDILCGISTNTFEISNKILKN